jgi:thioredoxin:protein disulfide reductase
LQQRHTKDPTTALYMSMQSKLWLILSLMFVLSSAAQAAFDLSPSVGQASDEAPTFLKVDQAFQYQASSVAGGLNLRWKITEGYYLYQGRMKFKSLDSKATIGEPQFSIQGKIKQDPYFGEVRVIHEDLEVFLPISLVEGATDSEIQISYQGCAEAGLCYPPRKQTELYMPLPSDAEAKNSMATNSELSQKAEDNSKTTQQAASYDLENANGVFSFMDQSSLISIAFIFFLLGLGLTFTPCVFPMIPIITSIIAGQDQSKVSMSRNFMLALAYVFGMALTYAAAGTITGLLGASANVQAALQNPYVLSVFAVVFVVLSLSMFGFYELQLPEKLRDKLNSSNQKLHGGYFFSVFVMGAISALVVSPCVSAPLAGALIYISTTGDALLGGLALLSLGLGMGVPLILVAMGGAKYLPKSGAWLDNTKAFFGVMLLAVAIWLLARFLPGQISMILWSTLALACGVQMGAFEAAQKGWARTFKAAGILLVIIGTLILIGAFSGSTNPLAPLENRFSSSDSMPRGLARKAELPFNVVTSYSGLEQELLAAKANNKTVLVDFYADWCISCIVMANEIFPQPDIHNLMSQIHLVKADVTTNSNENIALMQKYGIFGPPAFLFFEPSGAENKGLRVMGEITANDFKSRLTTLLASSNKQ